MGPWSRRNLISESRRPRCDQRWVSIFSRAALAKKADRVSPRGRCLVDCGEQANVQREICLNGPARIADERHDREHSVMRQCRSHFGIGTDGLDRAWLRQFLAIGERIFGP
jgi:hypothetical protein